MRGAGKDVRDLARIAAVVRHRTGPVECDIPGSVGKELRRAVGKRGAHVGDRIELLIIDRDLLGGVLRLRDALGDHQRDRLAGMQHALAGERRAERHDQLGAVAAVERRMRRGRADTGRLQILVGEHRDHAGRPARRLGVDRPDARMRVRRAHEHRVRLVLLRRILDEAAEPLHQRGILHARLEMMVVPGRLIHALFSVIRLASHTTQSSNINGAQARERARAHGFREKFQSVGKARGSSLYRARAAAP